MIIYEVFIKNDLGEEIEHLETKAKSKAVKKAKELVREGYESVFIGFRNTEDVNNFGYLNWDGHSPVGTTWA